MYVYITKTLKQRKTFLQQYAQNYLKTRDDALNEHFMWYMVALNIISSMVIHKVLEQ